jgi:prevent-host-death family protein
LVKTEHAMQVNLYEAKTRLSELVDQAHAGATVVIAKSGTPMARLVPLSDAPKRKVAFGLMKGEFEIPPDFDAPLPDELLGLFEGQVGS